MFEMVTTISSGLIKSSVERSSLSSMGVFLSSPNSSLTDNSSSSITSCNLSGFSRISFKAAISWRTSSYSLIKLSCSKPVSLCSLKSRIACACFEESL